MSNQAEAMRPPTEDEAQKAGEALEALASALTPAGALPIQVTSNGETTRIELPKALGQLVLDLLAHVSREEMVTFVPYGAELTTNQAADLLNVSRPHLIKLLNDQEIDFHKVGSHRRVKSEDVLAYKRKRDTARSSALDRMQQLGQEADAA
ncbi:helix-turn-helix domain-containing protein [Alteriqipengyuania abyssalis]|nr:helix-turn-helix domain-containing protein [Alteriqipengyuania abyssalis]